MSEMNTYKGGVHAFLRRMLKLSVNSLSIFACLYLFFMAILFNLSSQTAYRNDFFIETKNENKLQLYDFLASKKIININSLLRNEKQTPLTYSISHNYDIETVKMLLKNGADVDSPVDEAGDPFLFFVIRNVRSVEIINEIIAASSNVNVKDKNANTLLSIAFEKYMKPVIEKLVECGAETNVALAGGALVLNKSIELNLNFNAVKTIIEKSHDLNARDGEGWTALARALERRKLPIVHEIIINGADCAIAFPNGELPLNYSIDKNLNITIITEIIKKSVNVDAVDYAKKSPLEYAVYWRKNEIVDELIKKGANVNMKFSSGELPLNCGIEKNLNTAVIRKMIEKTSDLNARDVNEKTSLMAALIEKKPDVLDALIEKGADVNIAFPGGELPLNYVIEKGFSVPAVMKIIAKAADVNAVDKNKKNALMCALSVRKFEIADALVEKGADVNAAFPDGEPILTYVLMHCNSQTTIKKIIARTTNFGVKSLGGLTPFEIVKKIGNKDIANLLESKNIK